MKWALVWQDEAHLVIHIRVAEPGGFNLRGAEIFLHPFEGKTRSDAAGYDGPFSRNSAAIGIDPSLPVGSYTFCIRADDA